MPTTKHWTTEPDAEVNIKVSDRSLPANFISDLVRAPSFCVYELAR